MTLDQAWSQAIMWIQRGITVAFLIIISVTLLRHFGVSVPVRTMGHTELAYLAGAWWLLRSAK